VVEAGLVGAWNCGRWQAVYPRSRGDQEATVCYDYRHRRRTVGASPYDTRFFEPLAARGPRGTPTFADGQHLCLGATGRLELFGCRTGKPIWSHDIVTDVQAEGAGPKTTPAPQWGFSNSPLVVDGFFVIVFKLPGGENNKSLLAYEG